MKTKSKVIATAVAALIATILAVFGGEVAENLINRVLAIKAKEFLTPAHISNIINNNQKETYNVDTVGLSFADIYTRTRRDSYEAAFGNVEYSEYYVLRTIMVAGFKKQLHAGNGMEEVYDLCRDSFKKDMAKQTPAFRKAVLTLVQGSIDSFNAIKDPTYRQGFAGLMELEDEKSYGEYNRQTELHALLASNAGPEEIAKAASKTKGTRLIVEKPADMDVTKFALRRFNEGGIELIGKYIDVMRRIQMDVTDAGPTAE